MCTTQHDMSVVTSRNKTQRNSVIFRFNYYLIQEYNDKEMIIMMDYYDQQTSLVFVHSHVNATKLLY